MHFIIHRDAQSKNAQLQILLWQSYTNEYTRGGLSYLIVLLRVDDFFVPSKSLHVSRLVRVCLCAPRLWEWVHSLEFSHWRCQLALGDGKRAWVGPAVTSRSSRTSLPPSHFVSCYFLSSSLLRIGPFFYYPACSIPASPLLICCHFFCIAHNFQSFPPVCLCSCFVILCGNPTVLL